MVPFGGPGMNSFSLLTLRIKKARKTAISQVLRLIPLPVCRSPVPVTAPRS
ncbi:hypothetical protein LEMLEM_LOCUS6462 [Lemmus lemmus]